MMLRTHLEIVTRVKNILSFSPPSTPGARVVEGLAGNACFPTFRDLI